MISKAFKTLFLFMLLMACSILINQSNASEGIPDDILEGRMASLYLPLESIVTEYINYLEDTVDAIDEKSSSTRAKEVSGQSNDDGVDLDLLAKALYEKQIKQHNATLRLLKLLMQKDNYVNAVFDELMRQRLKILIIHQNTKHKGGETGSTDPADFDELTAEQQLCVTYLTNEMAMYSRMLRVAYEKLLEAPDKVCERNQQYLEASQSLLPYLKGDTDEIPHPDLVLSEDFSAYVGFSVCEIDIQKIHDGRIVSEVIYAHVEDLTEEYYQDLVQEYSRAGDTVHISDSSTNRKGKRKATRKCRSIAKAQRTEMRRKQRQQDQRAIQDAYQAQMSRVKAAMGRKLEESRNAPKTGPSYDGSNSSAPQSLSFVYDLAAAQKPPRYVPPTHRVKLKTKGVAKTPAATSPDVAKPVLEMAASGAECVSVDAAPIDMPVSVLSKAAQKIYNRLWIPDAKGMTYKTFKKLFEALGGTVNEATGSSHVKLYYGEHVGGTYRPHGKAHEYGFGMRHIKRLRKFLTVCGLDQKTLSSQS